MLRQEVGIFTGKKARDVKNLQVIAFNGSPRKSGNTHDMLQVVLQELERQGIQTQTMHIGGRPVRGCKDCGACYHSPLMKCAIDDWVNEAIEKMLKADGILIASPAYFGDLTPETKALMDRAGVVTRSKGYSALRHKVGAAVAVARRAAGMNVLDSINHFFTINEFVIPSSNYWNLAYGKDVGQALEDEEGVMIMKTLAENMAWVMKKLNQ